ncbi:tRNA pseudouridine(38-40) synthase TruA [Selenihalanaerobacter shriftii]|uniref:tRNA pseudouridine synthase A n=1 Tax=Selenihalanaerobacter shriftii TaxID=142842 RepID=A0A1T4Q6Z1_9FIRM|nr:tRNA pseudouridine(38-40) synthase TruA [Selenihalanaerobacter shriftii]SJZ98998.1 tRNA pseudouridine38-40 synthase [Selenihalanaerobacter shriftii]
MRYFKAIVEYDGTNYHGFQRQPNAITIQEVLESSLHILTKEEIKIIGASRTDSGVHACGQVINFETKTPIPIQRIRYAWNNCLPDDILIREVKEVDDEFHARYYSKGKIYEYHILNKELPSTFKRNYSYHIRKKLDSASMLKAAQYLVGTHDFSSFRASGCGANTTVRTINSFKINRIENNIICRVDGSGFLYNMIRIMVGTLLEVGFNKLQVKEVKEILEAKDRTEAGPTAPAHGLRLIKVKY